jgi:hypothetical protein
MASESQPKIIEQPGTLPAGKPTNHTSFALNIPKANVAPDSTRARLATGALRCASRPPRHRHVRTPASGRCRRDCCGRRLHEGALTPSTRAALTAQKSNCIRTLQPCSAGCLPSSLANPTSWIACVCEICMSVDFAARVFKLRGVQNLHYAVRHVLSAMCCPAERIHFAFVVRAVSTKLRYHVTYCWVPNSGKQGS